MLTIKILVVLKTKQGNLIASFLNENIGEGENSHIDIPKGFENYPKTGRKKCFNYNKRLYVLCQSPH